MNNYVVKPEDLTGDIEGFPIELVQWMVDQQVKQGNKADVGIFQKLRGVNHFGGGFDWNYSNLGKPACIDIITNKNFDLFFKHFPKQVEDKHFGLPELKAVEMEASEDGKEWFKLHVYGVKDGLYLSIGYSLWKHVRPIQQPVKLTRAEIAEKFGVSKDFILED